MRAFSGYRPIESLVLVLLGVASRRGRFTVMAGVLPGVVKEPRLAPESPIAGLMA